jgi:hypothetical protein
VGLAEIQNHDMSMNNHRTITKEQVYRLHQMKCILRNKDGQERHLIKGDQNMNIQELKYEIGKNYMEKEKKIKTEGKADIINEKKQYHSSEIKIGHVQQFTVKYQNAQKCMF